MTWDEGLPPGSAGYTIASSPASRLKVVAGPGTGKSFAMKRRVARLLESGVPPERILPVTFTKVAAEDLHRELVQMGVAGCENIRAMTLHSLALRGLMRAHVLQATGRVPRPLNDFERKPMERDLARNFGGIRQVQEFIKAYEAAWAREQADDPLAVEGRDLAFELALISWLTFHNAMLIGEVVPIFLQFLRNDPIAPERTAFSHILVDEYQDLNRAEQELLHLLSGTSEVCIVGDDDQSIYSFKHAHPEGIRTWCSEDHPPPTAIALDTCRRCPTRVVRMANALISRNVDRDPDRQLLPMNENGEGVVQIRRYQTIAQETASVANLVHDLVADGTPPGQILILAQRDIIGTPIYEGLLELGVPAKSYYSEAELETAFVQERYAYLKLLSNTDDRVALRWLLGLYSASWNEAGYRRVRQECEGTGLSPWAILSGLIEGDIFLPYTANIRLRFEEITARIDQLRVLLEAGGILAVVNELFPDDEPRVRDIRRVMIEVLEVDENLEIRPFLSAVDDAITKPEIPELVEDVRIMSLHKSKGLSAAVTVIAGCVEGLLPRRPKDSLPAQQQLASIEEQRRLFYVGMTRVRAMLGEGWPGHLILTSARDMPMADAMAKGIVPAQIVYGTARFNPSRFLGEFDGHGPQPQIG